ncbi:unnamed protein product [Aureobasidium pullulans]|nr:unnamed protein product [Aureobasidium pullulans]
MFSNNKIMSSNNKMMSSNNNIKSSNSKTKSFVKPFVQGFETIDDPFSVNQDTPLSPPRPRRRWRPPRPLPTCALTES